MSLFAAPLRMLLALSLVTGVLYPLAVTGIARIAFPARASGSLVERDGVVIGSRLVGQRFTSPARFWGRPSATRPVPYHALPSAGSNLGPLNPAWLDSVAARVAVLRSVDPSWTGPVPVDLVTASASGLDPHVSVAAALAQVPRVARARGAVPDSIRTLVLRGARPRWPLGLGEPVVNVLELNLALEDRKTR